LPVASLQNGSQNNKLPTNQHFIYRPIDFEGAIDQCLSELGNQNEFLAAVSTAFWRAWLTRMDAQYFAVAASLAVGS
jgi:hypothetical protein